MIRAAPAPAAVRPPAVNPMRGEFEVLIADRLRRFDTRLSTIAAIEAACGDRAIVEILNGIIAGRRARDVIPLLTAALAATGQADPDAADHAVRATVGEAEAFVLALIFALGFSVSREADADGRGAPPLGGSSSGGAGASSRSAP